MIQKNGKIFHALRLEELILLILLKWPYYPKQSTDLYQITHEIFHETVTNTAKIYLEPQEIQNCQSNPENKEQSRSHSPPRLQMVVQSYSNQNGVVLAQKQTMNKWNREPRNKCIHLQHLLKLIINRRGKTCILYIMYIIKDSIFSKWC